MQELSGRIVRIADPDDPRVAPFRDIRERDLRGRDGMLIAEGTVVLAALLDAQEAPGRPAIESVLVLENRLAGIAGHLQRLPAPVPVMVAERAVMDRIAGFPIHRGVLALARPRPLPDPAALLASLPPKALVLAASAISNHDNMGALFRNAAAFGADAVLLDERCCDPFYRKAIRVSVGAALKVPFSRAASLDAMVAALGGDGFSLWGLSPGAERSISGMMPARRTALLVGTEGEGLPASLLSRIDAVRIPQAPGLDSLNVATAAGIALYAVASAMGRLGGG